MAAILESPQIPPASGQVSTSEELLRRWLAGDEAALQEWLGDGVLELERTLRPQSSSQGERLIRRRRAARYANPEVGR